MKSIIPATLALTVGVASSLVFSGCASFKTIQTESVGKDGSKLVVTRVAARTLFDAKSDLAKFKAFQSDKTQSATVGALGQETTGTNAILMMDRFVELAKALPK